MFSTSEKRQLGDKYFIIIREEERYIEVKSKNTGLNILVRQSRLSGFIRATVPVIGSHQKCYAAKGSLHE